MEGLAHQMIEYIKTDEGNKIEIKARCKNCSACQVYKGDHAVWSERKDGSSTFCLVEPDIAIWHCGLHDVHWRYD